MYLQLELERAVNAGNSVAFGTLRFAGKMAVRATVLRIFFSRSFSFLFFLLADTRIRIVSFIVS